MARTIHRAKFVLAEPDLLLNNAAVSVSEQGQISSVESWSGGSGSEVFDWGSAVILPGLVNAHTHLELTRLRGRVGKSSRFTGWLSELIEMRRNWPPEEFLASTSEGARESLVSGTTLVGDISASGLSGQALRAENLRKIVYEEVIGLSPDRIPEYISALRTRITAAGQDPLLRAGVSPHAPYTVSPGLYAALGELARQNGLPLATHMAETRSELEFLERGTGEFRDFLAWLGVLPADWVAPGVRPVALLDSLGLLRQRPVLIHCNYLDGDSIGRILRSQSSVVFCPRSSTFFGHENHPVRSLLDQGVNVALGTDSLASNESLSILDEMRFLSRMRKDLMPEEVLRMATLNGAAALGFGGRLGRLVPGYLADMTILALPDSVAGRNLTSQVLEGAGECIATIVQGEVAWSRQEQV